jgi:cell division protein FtsB
VRLLILLLLVLLGLLQYRIWAGGDSQPQVLDLQRRSEAQQAENQRHRERNAQLEAEVRDLKEGLEAVEERARRELGMVKQGETFYLMVE